ncbi:MAG: DegT/DnrJ/EryC1/StrS family aminotransferase [Proteobacteria bacterium]|nr:DegT/DnrJ/EryC1/StrS family aminotransferase [Pseudomonadota bacterium]
MKIRKEYLPFGKPNFSDEEIIAVTRTIRSGWVGIGKETITFEKELAEYLEASHVVTVNSCTSALFLSLLVHGVEPGDEVICPSLTWCATANVALYLGAKPIFCDVDPVTLWWKHLRLSFKGIINTIIIGSISKRQEVENWDEICKKQVGKILLFRSAPVSQVKNLLLNLRDKFPQPEITMVVQPSVEPVFKKIPHVEKTFFLKEGIFSLFRLSNLSLWWKIWKEKYDVAVIPYNNPSGEGYEHLDFFALLTGSKVSIGINSEKKTFIFFWSLDNLLKTINRIFAGISALFLLLLSFPIIMMSFLARKMFLRPKRKIPR